MGVIYGLLQISLAGIVVHSSYPSVYPELQVKTGGY